MKKRTLTMAAGLLLSTVLFLVAFLLAGITPGLAQESEPPAMSATVEGRDLIREPIEFSITHDEIRALIGRDWQPGEAVSLLGDLPELGGGDIEHALDMPWTKERDANGAIVEWQVTVSLPVNRSYRFQFYLHPIWLCNKNIVQAQPLGPVHDGATSSVSVGRKTVFYHSDATDPIIHWRQGSEPFQELAMAEHAAQVAGRPSERRWVAQFGEGNRALEFFITDGPHGRRDWSSGTYRTALDRMLLQDGNLFTYIPAAQVSPARRDYDRNNAPLLWSQILGEYRMYRVWLPRGYDDHPNRHYPTIYAHDGQWWFADNPSTKDSNTNPWNQINPNGTTLFREVAQGRMREAILVLIDNLWESRTQDMLPPYVTDCGVEGPITGEGDLYREFIVDELMPFIDSHYRTLSGAENTGTVGLSYGGVAAFYHGWDFVDKKDRPLDFGRIGSFSGSFWVCGLREKINQDPRRNDIRVYLDSGNDNSWPSYLVYRDRFVHSEPTYEVENEVRYRNYCQKRHVGPHWNKRIPAMMNFLFPGVEEPDELPRLRKK